MMFKSRLLSGKSMRFILSMICVSFLYVLPAKAGWIKYMLYFNSYDGKIPCYSESTTYLQSIFAEKSHSEDKGIAIGYTYYYQFPVELFREPIKNGYVFKYWMSQDINIINHPLISGNAKVQEKVTKNQISGVVETQATVYAMWYKDPVTYSIAFDGNGNTSGTMSTMTGCEYNHYSGGTEYSPFLIVSPTEGYQLNKNQFKREFTATFDARGGESISSMTIASTFVGWEDHTPISYLNSLATDSYGTLDKIDTREYPLTEFDAAFYASNRPDIISNETFCRGVYNKYGLLRHYVQYGKGEGSVASKVSSGIYGSYPDQAWVTNLTMTNGATVTLKAQWSDNKIESLPNATRKGYSLDGWFYTDDSGVERKAGNAGEKFDYVISKNISLYAKWTPKPYNVKWSIDKNVGLTPATQSITYLQNCAASTFTIINKHFEIASVTKTVNLDGDVTGPTVLSVSDPKSFTYPASQVLGETTITVTTQRVSQDVTITRNNLDGHDCTVITVTKSPETVPTYTIVLSAQNPSVTIDRLGLGTYYITETTWANTYNKAAQQTITIQSSDTSDSRTVTLSGSKLPSTLYRAEGYKTNSF